MPPDIIIGRKPFQTSIALVRSHSSLLRNDKCPSSLQFILSARQPKPITGKQIPLARAYSARAYPARAYPARAYPARAYPARAYPARAKSKILSLEHTLEHTPLEHTPLEHTPLEHSIIYNTHT